MAVAETIASSGFPLGFKTCHGIRRSPVILGASGRDIFRVEARHLAGHHQKEAVVTEGSHGSAWRMVSDEGVHTKGDDLAPFPLGFFNAGLQADLTNRLQFLARIQRVVLDDVTLQCRTGYSMTGAFFRGDGVGYVEPARITVTLQSSASAAVISTLVAGAVHASPARAAMIIPVENTFTIYVIGRRHSVTTLPECGGEDAAHPLQTYSCAPSPLAGADGLTNLILKTGQKRDGAPTLTAPAATATQRIVREVAGRWRVNHNGTTGTDVALQLPGMSHFAIQSDESAADRAPSGLALLSAGIAFCYMTQLSRCIDYMKFNIRNVRLVQLNPYTFDGAIGGVEAGTTHLFLDGDESDDTHEKLMHISAATCFLHATLRAALVPQVAFELNGSYI